MLPTHLNEAVLCHCSVEELHKIHQTIPVFQVSAERVLQSRFPRLPLSFILKHTVKEAMLCEYKRNGTDSTRMSTSNFIIRQQWVSDTSTQMPLAGYTQLQVYSTYHECPLLFTNLPFRHKTISNYDPPIFITLLYDATTYYADNKVIWCDLHDPNAVILNRFTVTPNMTRHLLTKNSQLAPNGQAILVGSDILYCDGTVISLDLQPGAQAEWKCNALYDNGILLHKLH